MVVHVAQRNGLLIRPVVARSGQACQRNRGGVRERGVGEDFVWPPGAQRADDRFKSADVEGPREKHRPFTEVDAATAPQPAIPVARHQPTRELG